MKHKRTTTSALLLLGLCLTTLQAQTTMILKMKSGTSTAYVIDETQRMTFSGANLIITKKDATSASYAIATIQNTNFIRGDIATLTSAKQIQSKLTVYPNPVQDKLTISLVASSSEREQLDVFSINGTKVYSQVVSAQRTASHTLNVSSWQSGVYFVRITNGNETNTTKFTKN